LAFGLWALFFSNYVFKSKKLKFKVSETTETDKTLELKPVRREKDTWILELPAETCQREGFAEGTMVSLTFKDGGILTSLIRPSEKSKESAKRFIEKYRDFMIEATKNGD
jgi:hypothetical protein